MNTETTIKRGKDLPIFMLNAVAVLGAIGLLTRSDVGKTLLWILGGGAFCIFVVVGSIGVAVSTGRIPRSERGEKEIDDLMSLATRGVLVASWILDASWLIWNSFMHDALRGMFPAGWAGF